MKVRKTALLNIIDLVERRARNLAFVAAETQRIGSAEAARRYDLAAGKFAAALETLRTAIKESAFS